MGSRQNIVKHITYVSDFKMLDVRTPIVWNKPKSKIYNYNQEITGCYYKPMLDYVDSKERQGIFFEKPSEKIHLPEAAELALTDHTKISRTCGSGELKNALIKGYSQMAKESHLMTVRTQNEFVRGSKENTLLELKLTSSMLRDKYIKDLHVISSRNLIA